MRDKSYIIPSLLKPGNIGLFRLLLAVYQAGPEGVTTLKLLQHLNSVTHGQAFLKRAEREKLIERKRVPKPKGHKGNYFTVNRITERGKQLLRNQLVAEEG